MKILHLADLHIGKTIDLYDLKEDTIYVLNQIITIIKEQKINVVLIAGDIFDRSVPSETSVEIFNDFLNQIIDLKVYVLAIAGNHDSGIRVATYNKLLEKNTNFYIEGEYKGKLKKVTLKDEYGPINFYLLPFFRPFEINNALSIKEKLDDDKAFSKIMENEKFNLQERNVLIMHQFVAGYKTSGSEETLEVAGLSNIKIEKLKIFDYVALGHIHLPMMLTRESIRYAGSLLGYKINECGKIKSVPIIEFNDKKIPQIKLIDIKPLRPLVKITDYYDNVLKMEKNDKIYAYVELLDDKSHLNTASNIKEIFPYCVSINYKNLKINNDISKFNINSLTDEELIKEFYKLRTGKEIEQKDLNIVLNLLKENN